jgi:hypothetical protein
VVQGLVLTAGAVSLVATLDTVWARGIERLASRGRGLAPRLGLAYPLARRFRTSMLLGMFSLVILTMAFIAGMVEAFHDQSETYAAEARGGFDLFVDTNLANPVAAETLEDRAEVVRAVGLSRSFAAFDADITTPPTGHAKLSCIANVVVDQTEILTHHERDDCPVRVRKVFVANSPFAAITIVECSRLGSVSGVLHGKAVDRNVVSPTDDPLLTNRYFNHSAIRVISENDAALVVH